MQLDAIYAGKPLKAAIRDFGLMRNVSVIITACLP
jgi:hypothetical protein